MTYETKDYLHKYTGEVITMKKEELNAIIDECVNDEIFHSRSLWNQKGYNAALDDMSAALKEL